MHSTAFSCKFEMAHGKICGCDSLAQTSVCLFSSSLFTPLFVCICSSPFILRLISTFQLLLLWRSLRAVPPRAVSSRTVLGLMHVSHFFPDFFSSSSPVVRMQCISMHRAYYILIRGAAVHRCVHPEGLHSLSFWP
jgi:hypothetical protein